MGCVSAVPECLGDSGGRGGTLGVGHWARTPSPAACAAPAELGDVAHAEPLSDSNASMQGGNDYEIFEHPDTIGHTVVGPADTIKQTSDLFL